MSFIKNCINFSLEFVKESGKHIAFAPVLGALGSYTVIWLNSKVGLLAASSCMTPLTGAAFMSITVFSSCILDKYSSETKEANFLIGLGLSSLSMRYFKLITLPGALVNFVSTQVLLSVIMPVLNALNGEESNFLDN